MALRRVAEEAPGTVASVRQSGGKAMCPKGSSMADWLGAIGRFRTLALTVLQKKSGAASLGQLRFSGLLQI